MYKTLRPVIMSKTKTELRDKFRNQLMTIEGRDICSMLTLRLFYELKVIFDIFLHRVVQTLHQLVDIQDNTLTQTFLTSKRQNITIKIVCTGFKCYEVLPTDS